MSDTSPRDQDALLAGHVRPAAQPRTPGESMWSVTKDGHTIACELRDDSRVGGGWDVVIRQDGELSFSRRCENEASARYVANALKQDQINAGWTETRRGGPCP